MKNSKRSEILNTRTRKQQTKKNALKLTAIGISIAVSIGLTFPSFAEEKSLGNVDVAELKGQSANGNVSSESAVDIVAQVQNVKNEATNCADPANIDGLAHAQMKTLNDMKAMILTPVNTDAIFSTASKGGCFNALKNFPNLSASIPSLSGIADALKQTIIRYATRKVCAAVNDALSEAIGPIKDVISEITKNGEIDLTGAINKEIADELYKIDPELGRVNKANTDEYTWEMGDILKGDSQEDTEKNNGTDSVTDANSQNRTAETPKAASAGSFMTNTGEEQSDSHSDGSLTESAKSFLKSIF